MRKHVMVSVLVGLLATLALAAPATSDVTAPAAEPAISAPGSPVTLGPLNPIEQTPEMRALRSELARADASGDNSAIKAVEDRIQALYLASQPPNGVPVEAEPVPAQGGVADYGLDALVSARVWSSIAADYTMDGTMYAAAATLDSTAMVYRSTDHGASWSFLCGVQNSPKVLYDKVGLVVTGGDSARVFLFFLHPNSDGDVYLARYNLDGSGFYYTSVLIGADSIGDFAFCADNDNHYYLYGCAYSTTGTTLGNGKILRSTDYGVTWAATADFGNLKHVSYQNGAGAWQYLSTVVPLTGYPGQINALTNHSYGDPARWSETNLRPDTFMLEEPVFCPAFTTPETSATAWLAYHHLDSATSAYSVMTRYTQDGGATFSTPAALSREAGASDFWPDLKPYRSPGNDYMNISYISLTGSDIRRLYRRYCQAIDPGNWSDTTRVTSKEALRSHLQKPLLLYSPDGPGSGGGCVFVSYASSDSMFWNAPWQTGVAEPVAPKAAWRDLTPSLVRGVLMMEDRGRKTEDRAELLDVSGRWAMGLKPGANDVRTLAPGIYFVRQASSMMRGASSVTKVVITR
jgi:hypothetical protein